jgi:hypothetical protein
MAIKESKNWIISLLKRYWYVLVILFGAIIFSLFALMGQTFFYYDQARDAYEAYDIWHNLNPKILGPSTDIPGLFHGVLWFYLLSVAYAIHNSPQFVTLLVFILIFITVPVVGYLSYILFYSRRIATLSMILYAFSPLFQLSTRWLSNPVMGFFIIPFLMIALWKYLQKQTVFWAAVTGVCFGVLVQSDLAYALIIYLVPVYFLLYKRKPKIIPGITFVTTFVLMLLSYLISELKFQGQGISGTIIFITKSHEALGVSSELFAHIFQRMYNFFSISFFLVPLSVFIFLFVGFILVLWKNRSKFSPEILYLTLWLSNILVFMIFSTGISHSLFVFYPSLVALILLVSFSLHKLFPQNAVICIVLVLIVIFQINNSLGYIKQVQNPLTVQKDMVLPLEKKVIDYTYHASGLAPFTINTVTSPLYINTTWAYLYNFYAQPKYGYVPFWDGKDQAGRLGNLPSKSTTTQYRYLIIEPSIGIPDIFISQTISEENQVSTLVEEKRIGSFRIQKRLSNKEKDNTVK